VDSGEMQTCAISLAAGQLLVPLAMRLLGEGPVPSRIFAVVGVGFPVLAYTFLAELWMVKLWRDVYRRLSH
jgi:hypothetical protein